MTLGEAACPRLCQSLTPELRSLAVERARLRLLKIIRANFKTQYASNVASLARFRDAISVHGSSSDTVLVEDFRRCVPLSDYESYKPFMAVFDKHPCKEAELENLFAPGLPSFLAISGATSGKQPKILAKYHVPKLAAFFESPGLTAAVMYHGYREVKEVEREPGQIVKKILVSILSSGLTRATMGWTDVDDDNSRMSLIMPGFVAPWATSMINHYKSYLVVHALFALACRDLDHLSTSFSTQLYDLIRHIHEEWDMFLSSIMNGTVPDLPGIDEVRSHLQANLHANPERAAELRVIGPPFSCETWAVRVWPRLKMITVVCSGPFASLIPKLRSIIGPDVTIRAPGYLSSESSMGVPHQPDDLHKFILRCNDITEFLDITAEESHENLRQSWELEVGKEYEVMLTTNDGLWRYRLGDVIVVVGFDADSGFPVFSISGRKSLAIPLPGPFVTDTQLMQAMEAVSPDIMRVHEFTTVLDDRESTRTVGYFVELTGTLGPNAHLAPSRLSEGLAAANVEFQEMLDTAMSRHPTVRIVGPGTFAAYRQWRVEKMGVGPGQVKVPVVLLDPTSIEWIMKKVIGEL